MTVMDFSGNMLQNGSIGIPWKPEEERRLVDDLMREAEANAKEGDLYYVISARWFANWLKYTHEAVTCYCMDESSEETCPLMLSNRGERPGPIDNTNIIMMEDDDPQLLCNMEKNRDYKLIPHQVWQQLYEWYKGGPALPRKMISLGDKNELTVEVFPLRLNLIDSRDNSGAIISLSRKASLHELYERVGELKSLEPKKVRLWDHYNSTTQVLISSQKTLEEALLMMNNDILVEVQIDGIWPSGKDMDSTGNELALVPVEPMGLSFGRTGLSCILGDSDDSFENLKDVPEEFKGQAGLKNLGNTCFMNSALQCLVHTPELVEYFLNDVRDEINKDNPLGMNGELALGFGSLLRKLWLSDRRPVAPSEFKVKLGRFAPQFSGYNQHDSQEFLAFLLDGLHEDLNRVRQKPYIEAKDFDDRPDNEIAEDLWRYHKARNDSVIVDTFQGQYKSTLVCPDCEKISITFDPFMYLSLPLPSRATREMTVTVIYGDGSRLPVPYTVTVLEQGCCADLQKALGAACGLRNDEYLLLAEVFDNRIFTYYERPTEPLESIKDYDNIVAYILPQRASELTRLEICHRYLERTIFMATERKLFLTPLVTFLQNPQSGGDIDLAASRILSPFRRIPPCNSTMINLAEESGTFTNSVDTPDNESNTLAGQKNSSIGGLAFEERERSAIRFQICITNGQSLNSLPIVKDTPIQPAREVKVMLDWLGKSHELYDIGCLMDIPKVCNTTSFEKKKEDDPIPLLSCLDAFMKEEPLGPDDMWYCPHCKENRQATKKLDLFRLPNILVFHLKRFSYGRWARDKLDDFVDFPLENLDLSKYVKCKDASGKSHIYDLYAISNHYGGLGFGHYTAHTKFKDGKWYHFDDMRVSSVEESEVKSSAAYVLFYKRVSVDVEAKHSKGEVGESSQEC